METFKINIRFRGKHVNGYVQKFNDHFDVFFQDEDVLKEIGGMVSFDSDGKFKSARKPTADDANKFYKAISDQLQ